MAIQLKTNPTDKVIELGGGSHPLVRPNVDVRICHDAEGNRTVDFTADFHQPLPIQSDEWDGVFSQFAIEHIAYPKVPQFLQEIYRILKPGGKAVIVTANTEAQLRWALDHPDGWDGKDMFESASCKLFGDQRYGEREGDPNPNYDSHKVYFSPSILTRLFQDAGFEDVKWTPYGARGTDIVVEAVKFVGTTYRSQEEKRKDFPLPKQLADFPVEREELSKSLNRTMDKMILGESVKDPIGEGPAPARDQSSAVRPSGSIPVHLPRSYQPEKLFDRAYFNGGIYKPFYWDFPAHEITARHVLSRKPESVLELGCGRGYVLKRLQDAGVSFAQGMEVSKHCYLTRAADGVLLHDITNPWPYQNSGENRIDLCFSIAVLDHIPEEFLPAVFAEMERTCKRGLHGINFGPAGDDKTRVTIHPKEWWQLRLPRGHEVVDKNELESGAFPEDVYRGDSKVKLNLGCAQTMFHHGWTNIDIHNIQQWAQGHGYLYQQLDLRNGIPWGTGDVSLIYCGHMLEHLGYKEGLTFLRDCRRVMRPDGAMRIIVPDAGLLTGLYANEQEGEARDRYLRLSDFDEVNDGCALAPTAAGKLWALLHEGHQAAYDGETLMALLDEAGFHARRSLFRRIDDPDINHAGGMRCEHEGLKQILRETLDTHPALSLYVNAIPKVG